MTRHENTLGIVLRRINYGEADRIITIITPSHGKITVMARGVRKEKSKLAGGIELFSVSNISFIPGKRDIGTLVSTRLKTNYKNIIKDIGGTTLAYDVLKLIDKTTELNCEAEYFELLQKTLSAIDDSQTPNPLAEVWFLMHILMLRGHGLNLKSDNTGKKLIGGQKYNFDYEHMAFFAHPQGKFTDKHIKLLRLLCATTIVNMSDTTDDTDKLIAECKMLIKPIIQEGI